MDSCPQGPSGKVSGPKGPCACLFFAPSHVLFIIFHYIYATFIMPFIVLLTTRWGPFWAPGGGMAPLPPPPGYASVYKTRHKILQLNAMICMCHLTWLGSLGVSLPLPVRGWGKDIRNCNTKTPHLHVCSGLLVYSIQVSWN